MLLFQLNACSTHHFRQWSHQLVEECTLRTELIAMTNGTTNDTTQYITTTFVRRHHAIHNQKGT
ncbi:Uncharacterised protein [Vibrio cholerae]|nr:Uncharacterised protein [Vibrio cholerae]CSD27599.1 Uncharacterised protein [Vibrio cholerae]CSI04090.1 Uncharacterised protein [Vibrio cholerae]